MTMRIGDDGEIEFLEPTEKPKRKKKSFTQRGLQGCAQLFFLAVFFVFGSIGGFAFYFVRNPGSSQNAHSTVVCVGQIKTIRRTFERFAQSAISNKCCACWRQSVSSV